MKRGSARTDSDNQSWGAVAQYILAYLLWFLFSALCFWAIWLIRTNLVEDIFFGKVDPWQLRAIDRWSVWLLGAVWVVGIFLAEGYLRTGVEKNRMLAHTAKLFLIPILIIALSYLFHWL